MRRIAVVLVILSSAITLLAQAPPSRPDVKFEVASVKENTSTSSPQSYRWEPTGLRVSNLPLYGLLVFAYGVTNPEGFIGVPGWVRTTGFDIAAKLDGALTRPDVERRTALQNLLIDRFQLVMRPTTRDTDVYSLVISDAGIRMRISELKCDGPTATECRFSMDRAKGTLSGRGMTISELSSALRLIVGMPVVDRTSLKDRYDLSLQWSPEVGRVSLERAPDGASIFTAVQEQLGLRLVAGKAPGNAFIIERIERPTPD